MRRVIAARQAAGPRSLGPRARSRQFFIDHGETLQGRVGDGAARGRADHHVQDRAWRGRLDRPLPRPAPRLDRQARPQCVQADPRVAAPIGAATRRTRCCSRIYGTAWLNKKQLDAHLVRLEEAAKRDHRKIGQEMDLFHLQAEAQGSVFWHPNGYIIWRQLEAYMRRRLDAAGYEEIKTPQLMDARQWERSRPLGQVSREHVRRPRRNPRRPRTMRRSCRATRELMALKPMNCPAHVLDLQAGHQELPRPAAPPRRVRLLPPQRAARRAARHPARPPVHAGRRAHLLPRGPAGRRGRGVLRPARQRLQGPRLRQIRDQARASAGQAVRLATKCGTGRSSACATPSRRPAATPRNLAGRSCRAKAPSMRPSSNGI